MSFIRIEIKQTIDGPVTKVAILKNVKSGSSGGSAEKINEKVSNGVQVMSNNKLKSRTLNVTIIISNIWITVPPSPDENVSVIDLAKPGADNFADYADLVKLLLESYLVITTNLRYVHKFENAVLVSYDNPLQNAHGGFEANLVFEEFFVATVRREKASLIKRSKTSSGTAGSKKNQTSGNPDNIGEQTRPDVPDHDSLAVDAIQSMQSGDFKKALKGIAAAGKAAFGL